MSTGNVRILDDQVVNQIAAGEVVERPASVVKELVENSIDAGATDISVVLVNGGRSSIEVIDNGSGMSKDDAFLAIERFGTSKIRSVDDLSSIRSHGFRGEALPSIASVSRFRLSTALRKPVGDPSADLVITGVQFQIEGGRLHEVLDAGISPGTRVEVKNLFFNVPARRKFLRTEATEAGMVRALMIDFALAYPSVRFRLMLDGTEVANYPPGRDFFARARELNLAGERPFAVEHQLETAAGSVVVQAFLSQPVECVTNAGRLRLLVNRRSVRDRLMLRAVREGYGNFLRPGRYPMGVVSLELPPGEVDVNVHPQKTEVRFRRPELVFASVTQGISRTLTSFPGTQAAEEPGPESAEGEAFSSSVGASLNFHGESFVHEPRVVQWPSLEQTNFLAAPAAATAAAAGARSITPVAHEMRYVGQLLSCYLVLEGGSRVALVDMHAAHERVMFYRLKSQFKNGGVYSQMLLIPEVVELPPERVAEFENFQTALQQLGIEADRISETAVTVRAVPALLSGISGRSIFAELSALPEWGNWGEALEHRWDQAIARLACHRSVRSGRTLEPREAYELLESLSEADASGFCPHGRPIVKWLSERDLETMFGRTE